MRNFQARVWRVPEKKQHSKSALYALGARCPLENQR